jgi:hypothetical protein
VAAKKLEESFSTAPSGFFSATGHFFITLIRAFLVFLMPDAITALQSYTFFPWSVPKENSRNFLRPAAIPLPACYKNNRSSLAHTWVILGNRHLRQVK